MSADGNEATTKLSSALKFVIALDERESGHQLIDATYAAYDPCLGDPVGAAKRDGYDDSEVRRTPSHRWLKPGAKIVPGPPKHRGRSSYPPEQYDAEA